MSVTVCMCAYEYVYVSVALFIRFLQLGMIKTNRKYRVVVRAIIAWPARLRDDSVVGTDEASWTDIAFAYVGCSHLADDKAYWTLLWRDGA